MIFRADFSAGGLTLKTRCVYVLVFRRGQEVWRYVGRTGTSNRTGISSPFGRLGKHLAKVGKTQSCIWDSSRLPKELLKKATLSFVALPLSENRVDRAERWLRWRVGSQRTLNKEKIPISEPKISVLLRDQLTGTFFPVDENG